MIHADVSVDGRTHEVYLCASEDFKAKSESKIAQETIEETFGASNQLVVMVPKGDYESEHKVEKKLQNLDYVTSALASC